MSRTTDPRRYQTPTSAAAAAVLHQLSDFIGSLPEGVYERPCPTMMGASIGQHLRHSVDHVRAILDGIETGVIDYDHRERGVRIETDREEAAAVIGSLIERLADVDEDTAGREVVVRVMLSSDGESAELATTVGREFAFAAHHETHHHAMMTVIAQSEGCGAPRGFGVAPSTLNHDGSN